MSRPFDMKKMPAALLLVFCLLVILSSDKPILDGASTGDTTCQMQEGYSLSIDLYGNNEILASSGSIELDQLAYSELLKSLDGISWSNMDTIANPSIIVGFEVTANGEAFTYLFSNDGVLIKDGKMAQMNDSILYHLFQFLGGQDEEPQNYLCWLPDGAEMQLKLEFGNFELTRKAPAPPNLSAFGRYGRIGDYIIVSNGFEDEKKLPVFYVFEQDGVTLKFCSGLSRVDNEWNLPEGVLLALDSALTIELDYRVFWEEGLPDDINVSIQISAQDYLELRMILDRQLWWIEPNEAKKTKPIGSFTITTSFENNAATQVLSEKEYYFTAGSRFVNGDRYSDVKAEVGTKLYSLLRAVDDNYARIAGTYAVVDSTGEKIFLILNEDGTYQVVLCTEPYRVVNGFHFFETAWYPIANGYYTVIDDMPILWNERDEHYYCLFLRHTAVGLEMTRYNYIYTSEYKYLESPIRLSDDGVPMKLSFLSQEASESGYKDVDPALTWKLFNMLENTPCWNGEEDIAPDIPKENMQLHIQLGEDTLTYSICDEQYIKYEDRLVKLTDAQWSILMQVISYLSENV